MALQDKLTAIKEKYEESSGGVNDLTQTLATITEELERVKIQMDERGMYCIVLRCSLLTSLFVACY